eukprot:3295883-Pleurochrysis_carterae.AAC.1
MVWYGNNSSAYCEDVSLRGPEVVPRGGIICKNIVAAKVVEKIPSSEDFTLSLAAAHAQDAGPRAAAAVADGHLSPWLTQEEKRLETYSRGPHNS